MVNTWLEMDDMDEYSEQSVEQRKVFEGINTLNGGKAPGDDAITKEHLKNAGPKMVEILTLIFNWELELEYIPTNFRRGVQIPLYKGKNSSIVDVNNYRGITLRCTFNKPFEIVVWKRLSPWLNESAVLSRLQGACKKGISCMVGNSYCDLCNTMSLENTEHVIMQCPGLTTIREQMFEQINLLENNTGTQIISYSRNVFRTMLGDLPANLQPEIVIDYRKIVSKNVYSMYRTILTNREGVG